MHASIRALTHLRQTGRTKGARIGHTGGLMTIEFDRSRVTVVDHPLVQHKLTIMRSEQTGSK